MPDDNRMVGGTWTLQRPTVDVIMRYLGVADLGRVEQQLAVRYAVKQGLLTDLEVEVLTDAGLIA